MAESNNNLHENPIEKLLAQLRAEAERLRRESQKLFEHIQSLDEKISQGKGRLKPRRKKKGE